MVKIMGDVASKHEDEEQGTQPVSQYYGLENQGATCYLNSVLQILFMTTEIHKRLDPKASAIDGVLKNLFKDLQNKTCKPERITETLGIKNVHQQYDAAFCLEDILHKVSPQVSEIFKGQLNDTTTCSEGHIITEEEKPSLILPLALKDANDGNYKVTNGFEEIFKERSHSGDNMVYCTECDEKTEATSICRMEKCPEILILLLKRFDRDYRTRKYFKSDCCVEIPGSLEIKDKKYKLYGMVNHMGGLRGGHYTATVLSEENQTWYEFNDSRVTEVKQLFANDTQFKSRTAYLLMYREPQEVRETKKKKNKMKSGVSGGQKGHKEDHRTKFDNKDSLDEKKHETVTLAAGKEKKGKWSFLHSKRNKEKFKASSETNLRESPKLRHQTHHTWERVRGYFSMKKRVQPAS